MSNQFTADWATFIFPPKKETPVASEAAKRKMDALLKAEERRIEREEKEATRDPWE